MNTDNDMLLEVHKNLVVKILQRHKSNNYSQCSICDSAILDLRELATTLYSIYVETDDSEDELIGEFGEQCFELFREIVDFGFHEDCFRNEDFTNKWFEENEYRFSQKLSDEFFEAVYFKPYKDVVLKTDSSCGCFKKSSCVNGAPLNLGLERGH